MAHGNGRGGRAAVVRPVGRLPAARSGSRQRLGRRLAVRSLVTAAAVSLVFTAPVALPAQAPHELLIAVLDRSGTPVLDLAPSDFSIVQGAAELDVLSAEVDLVDAAAPMKVALLVDDGVPGRLLTPLRTGLDAFLDALPPLHELAPLAPLPDSRMPRRIWRRGLANH